MQHWQVFQGEE